jgi:hypothetical protein
MATPPRGRLPLFCSSNLLFLNMRKSFQSNAGRIIGLFLVATVAFLGKSPAQLYIGVEAAPGFETITLREATITRGYNLAVMPQAALKLRYDYGAHIGLRLGFGWMPKGAKVWFGDDSTNGISSGTSTLQARYVAARAGFELRTAVSPRFSVLGCMDFVFGKLGQSRRILPNRKGSVPFDDFFADGFFGLDFGIAVQYQFEGGIGFRLTPTLEIQLNQAYQSNFFMPEFRGFSPRMEIFFPIFRK